MAEPGRTAAIAEWWRSLSGAWRANVALYAVATLALVALLVQIVAGDGNPPQRVEVASRAPVTTALQAPRLQPSTTTGPTTTVGGGSTTTSVVPTPAPGPVPPSTPPPPAPLTVDPAAPEEPAPGPNCRNSTDPVCGAFYWDPAPGPNQGISVSVSPSTATPTTGVDVVFTVKVTDPDHRVTENCAEIDWGDGHVDPLPCNPAPCAEAHGAWTPPPAVGDTRTFAVSHRYEQPGQVIPNFTFRTDRDEPCPNPYGSVGSGATAVAVQPAS